jgi:uncharacterized protein (DUF433 family)
MSTATTYPHLTFDASGTAHLGQTRYKVAHLAAEHYHYGWTAEELLRQHPDLRPEEVYSALTYFYDHFDQMTSAMQPPEDAGQTQPFTREELLKRRAGAS